MTLRAVFILFGFSLSLALAGCSTEPKTLAVSEPKSQAVSSVADKSAADANLKAPRAKQFPILGQYPSGPDNCVQGSNRRGFTQSIVSGDAPCFEGTQTCLNGVWVGPTLFRTCENHTKSCDGRLHGSMKTGYLQPTTSRGTACPTATVTCINGAWVGPHVFDRCVEL